MPTSWLRWPTGIVEYGIANACYRLAGLLRREAAELEAAGEAG